MRMSGAKVNFQVFSGLGLHTLILKPPRKKYTSSFNILRPTFIVARFVRVCLTSLPLGSNPFSIPSFRSYLYPPRLTRAFYPRYTWLALVSLALSDLSLLRLSLYRIRQLLGRQAIVWIHD